MPVDTAAHVGDFDATKPVGGDPLSEMDNNFRQIKTAIKTDFPNIKGVVSASHTELSYVAGVTSAIQTQLDAKAPIASPTFTGTPSAPTAALATSTTQLATTQFVANTLASAVGSTGLLSLSISNSAAVTLIKGQHDASTFAGVVTWTLPASPAAGDTVAVTPLNGRTDAVIARNGLNIMGLAEDMTVDNANATITLRYTNASQGWRLV